MLTLAKRLWITITMMIVLGVQAARSGDPLPALLCGFLLGCLSASFADAWESRRWEEIDA